MIINTVVKNSIDLGFVRIHLYGIIYTISFLLVYLFTEKTLEKRGIKLASNDSIGLLGFLFFISIFFARIFYVFVYWGKEYLKNPIDILKIWDGGLSFHGGLIGTLIGLAIYSKINKISFKKLADILSLNIPIALFLGRVGHFLNGEMWGRITNGEWGVIFIQSAENPVPRHPVQLYEAFFEGIVLFFSLKFFANRKLKDGQIFSLFLIFSGLFRFLTEFFREPDQQLGFIFNSLTMGQLLSIPVILSGIISYFMLNKS
ncbi:MAG: prolipoprotein diacylglyceryl transferase [Candidatus Sericytochromatia bacterium]